MKRVDTLTALLLVVGGLNWGLVGFFDFNLIEYFICRMWLDRVIYVLIGFSALYHIGAWKSIRARWRGSKK